MSFLFIFGRTKSGTKARKNKITGKVEFELWEMGHPKGYKKKPFWHELGPGHEFIPDKE